MDKTVTWIAASSSCEALGSKLAVVNSQAENQAIVVTLFAENTWIGLYRDPENNSRWLWVDGSRPSYTNWDRNEPGDSEGCAVITKSGFWHSYPCDDNRIPSYYCETFGEYVLHLEN